MSVTREQIEGAIEGFTEPHLQKNLVAAKVIKDIAIDGASVKVAIELGFPAKGAVDAIAAEPQDLLGMD